MLNIPSYIEDPSYRYKMPRLQTRIEGRGNGIKTALPNLQEVAKALKVPTEFPTKWFGCELGAQSMITEDRAIVNGSHTLDTMQESLDRFIDKYVLCQKCKLPEITLSVSKKNISGQCSACGWTGLMDSVHKVATYIVNHKELLASSKLLNTQDISTKDQVTSAPALQLPLEPLTVEDNYDQLLAEVIKPLASESPSSLPVELKRRQSALAFDNCVKLFCALVLTFSAPPVLTGTTVAAKLPELRKLVPKSTTEETLRAFELFFWKHPLVSMRDYPMILKALFDEDWVSEKSLLKRYDGKNSTRLGFTDAKKKAQPFVQWLKEAELEDDSDD